jgi:hypothetical protein
MSGVSEDVSAIRDDISLVLERMKRLEDRQDALLEASQSQRMGILNHSSQTPSSGMFPSCWMELSTQEDILHALKRLQMHSPAMQCITRLCRHCCHQGSLI